MYIYFLQTLLGQEQENQREIESEKQKLAKETEVTYLPINLT